MSLLALFDRSRRAPDHRAVFRAFADCLARLSGEGARLRRTG